MLTKGVVRALKKTKMLARPFAGHAKAYDWRDDPKYNPDITQNPRFLGYDVESYVCPNEGHDNWYWDFNVRAYDKSDITLVAQPENHKFEVLQTMPPAYWDMLHDFAHEADYESEDLDFQPENFKTQHFKKRGPIWAWIAVAVLPVVFMFVEFLYQKYPDEEMWRKPVAPPLDYPNPQDTPDTAMYQISKTRSARYLEDTGMFEPFYFDIVDGKKVYKKFAGVNAPLLDI